MTGKQKIGILRELLDWCKDFNKDHFKDTPSFITAIMPLVNQEPDEEWAVRVKDAAVEWSLNATEIQDKVVAQEEPDVHYYSMFCHAVWSLAEGEWAKVAAYFGDE